MRLVISVRAFGPPAAEEAYGAKRTSPGAWARAVRKGASKRALSAASWKRFRRSICASSEEQAAWRASFWACSRMFHCWLPAPAVKFHEAASPHFSPVDLQSKRPSLSCMMPVEGPRARASLLPERPASEEREQPGNGGRFPSAPRERGGESPAFHRGLTFSKFPFHRGPASVPKRFPPFRPPEAERGGGGDGTRGSGVVKPNK